MSVTNLDKNVTFAIILIVKQYNVLVDICDIIGFTNIVEQPIIIVGIKKPINAFDFLVYKSYALFSFDDNVFLS